MELDYHNVQAVHRKQLAAFLEFDEMDRGLLEHTMAHSEDPRVRDMCRLLLSTIGVHDSRLLAGREGNLDSLLKRRNAARLCNRIKVL